MVKVVKHHEWPLIRNFLAELDDIFTGDDFRDFRALEEVLYHALDYRRINEVVDAALRSGMPGGDWLYKQIHEAQGQVTRGKAEATFHHMEERVKAIRGR